MKKFLLNLLLSKEEKALIKGSLMLYADLTGATMNDTCREESMNASLLASKFPYKNSELFPLNQSELETKIHLKYKAQIESIQKSLYALYSRYSDLELELKWKDRV